MLSSEAAVSALTEICALPEGSKLQEEALCSERPPRLIRAMDFAEPSFVFMMEGKVILPPDTRAAIPPVEEDYRPAWLIDIGGEGGRTALGELIGAANEAGRCLRMSRRYVYNYLVRDFNVGSLYSLFGTLLVLAGSAFGSVHWLNSAHSNHPATSGTVMLAALPIMIGIQCLIAFLHYDVSNIPTEPLSRSLSMPQADES